MAPTERPRRIRGRSRALAGVAAAAATVLVAAAVTLGPASTPGPTGATAGPSTSSRPPAAGIPRRHPEAVFIGDSFTAGYGATSPERSFVVLVGTAEGWQVENLGLGSTGYVTGITEGGYDSCGMGACPSYGGMIAQAAALVPDIVVVSGGVNDAGTDSAAERDAIVTFYRDLRASLPDATILATSPLPDGDAPGDGLVEIRTAAADAVESVGGTYLDIGQPLTGRPDLLSPDGVHPNDAGHAAIAEALLTALNAAGNPGSPG